MRTITVICGAIVPVLANSKENIFFFNNNIVLTLTSLIVVIFVSLESVFHFREQWKNYRATEQLLAKEYFNFVSGEGFYKNKESKEAFLDFVDRIENAIESENASTLNVMTTLTDKK